MFPQSLKTFKHKSIFVKMLVIFNAFIISTILIFGYVSYSKSSSLLIEEVVTSNNKYIEQARNNIDRAIESWDVLSFQVSLQNPIRRALYLSEQTWNLDQMLFLDVIQYLKSVKLANPLISDIWLQPYRYPVVLNHESKYNSDYFYSQLYTTKPEIGWRKIETGHFGYTFMGRFDVVSSDASQSVITFARTVPLSEVSPTGILYMNVKTEDLANMLQSTSDPYPAFIYAIDASGQLVINSSVRSEHDQRIYSVKGIIADKVKAQGTREGYLEEKISGESYQIVFTSSYVNGWTYISAVPTAFITEKANKFRQFTLFAAVLYLAVGVIISYFLTERMYRPIYNIIAYMNLFERKKDEMPGIRKEDELGFIDRIINYVYFENHQLKGEFEKNLPALQQKILYDLIEGRVSSEKMAEAAEKLQLPFVFDAYQIIVFETVDFSVDEQLSPHEPDIISMIDQMAAKTDAEPQHFAVKSIKKRVNKIVTIVNLDSRNPNPELISDLICRVTNFFIREHGRTFTIGIGNVYKRVEDVPFSYVDALTALEYKLVKGQGSVIYVDEVSKLPDRSYIYSFDTEKRIINAVKTGSTTTLSELLQVLWKDNLESAPPTPEIVHHLFHALAGTAVRTIYEIGSTTEEIFGRSFSLYRELDLQPGVENKKQCIEEAFRIIGEWIQGKKQGQYTQLLGKVEQFVRTNYHRDLSLAVVGEALGLSSSYLSSIFKDITGMSFVDYVNSKRIEQAKLLLQTTNHSVADISERVGFTSSNTFIRVFKRHEGVTPGQFRQ
ncbi:helix-turn-helix domain-containing protein [Paenibacillus sp. OAS669]|uniref:helix-turn-helix domain-containing protein n=1 Tax=Paenibacillus sp. OAS669 TaxID=2663821 RepID=UPI00178B6F0E|nr:helix-turn-helix domain-containing protein [Paenibacillus sp. OAS669]MBE1442615.1 AraC-like DNA-binding protein [Paenibacillus sp. OAS669]